MGPSMLSLVLFSSAALQAATVEHAVGGSLQSGICKELQEEAPSSLELLQVRPANNEYAEHDGTAEHGVTAVEMAQTVEHAVNAANMAQHLEQDRAELAKYDAVGEAAAILGAHAQQAANAEIAQQAVSSEHAELNFDSSNPELPVGVAKLVALKEANWERAVEIADQQAKKLNVLQKSLDKEAALVALYAKPDPQAWANATWRKGVERAVEVAKREHTSLEKTFRKLTRTLKAPPVQKDNAKLDPRAKDLLKTALAAAEQETRTTVDDMLKKDEKDRARAAQQAAKAEEMKLAKAAKAEERKLAKAAYEKKRAKAKKQRARAAAAQKLAKEAKMKAAQAPKHEEAAQKLAKEAQKSEGVDKAKDKAKAEKQARQKLAARLHEEEKQAKAAEAEKLKKEEKTNKQAEAKKTTK